MADFKTKYGTLTDLGMNLGALADATAYESNVIDNETDLFIDSFVFAKIKNHATTVPTGEAACHFYVYGGLDDAEPTSDGTDGVEGTFTLNDAGHLGYLGSIYFSAAAQTQEGHPWSVANAFQGAIPAKWGVVIVNRTGAALDASDASHTVKHRGIHYQTV